MLRRVLLAGLLVLGGVIPLGAGEAGGTAWKTKHVVVLVIDGPRWTETWGKPGRDLIPVRDKVLAPQGVLLSDMAPHTTGDRLSDQYHTCIIRGRHERLLSEQPSKSSTNVESI